jgi:hypothetical protein
LFSEYPFGTDLTREEIELAGALRWLKDASGGTAGRLVTLARALLTGLRERDRHLLERMQLASPRNFREKLDAKLVSLGLRAGARGAATSRTAAQDP